MRPWNPVARRRPRPREPPNRRRPGGRVPCARAGPRVRCPTPYLRAQGHRHHLAVVESADRNLLGDDGNRGAAQTQARHLLLNRPHFLAGLGIETAQSAVDRTQHDHVFADRGRGQQFGVDVRAPKLATRRAVERYHVALAGSHHDHAEIRGRSGRERQFQILFPQMAARIERDREHFALVRGGVHRLVVDCGPQAEPQYHLLLAATHALTPELLDRQRLRKVDELRRRLDILVLAAARSDDQGREA